MSLPTPQKTWLTATIVGAQVSDTVNQRDTIIKIKNQRKAWGHVVVGSSDTSTGGLDGIDRWNVTTDLPTFQVPWLVMKQPGSSAQDLIYYANFGESDWGIIHSPGGLFTGSGMSLPTATDQVTLYTNSWFGRGDGGGNPQFIVNLWCSSDLTCFRQSFWFNGNNFGNIFFDAVDGATSGWAFPNYAVMDRHGVGIATAQDTALLPNYVYTPYTGAGLFKSWGPHGAMNMLGTVVGTGYGSLYTLPGQSNLKNKISNTYRLGDARCGLYEPIANADGGWHGRVFDLWWVQLNKALFNPGDLLPLDGSRKFAIVGDYMLPWNGGAFRIT